MTHKAKKKGNDSKTRVEDLARLHRDIEFQIMMADEDDLQLLASLYLMTSYNILFSLKGPNKTKVIFQEFIDKMKVEKLIDN